VGGRRKEEQVFNFHGNARREEKALDSDGIGGVGKGF
jgi:hypothetical protein